MLDKRLSYVLTAASVVLTIGFLPPVAVNSAISAQTEPEYAKWGQLAMKETKLRYPGARIVDYLHVGRKTLSENVCEETFKLWLLQNSREWGVYVRIQFEPATGKVRSVTFQETSR